MSHWYTKARNTLISRRAGAVEPTPFSRTCQCGEAISGERLPQAREIRCPACGRDWFILPADPYPGTKSRKRPPPPHRPAWLRRRQDASGPASIRSDTRPNDPATVSPAAPTGSDQVADTDEAADWTAASAVESSPAAIAANDAPRRSAWERVRARSVDWFHREARPIRIVLAVCLAAAMLTGFWLWHRARIDEASATIVRVLPLAESALDDGNFAEAQQYLSQAVAAVDLLGTENETSIRIRQRHRELVALNHLAGKTPFDLAFEAGLNDSHPDQWEADFEAAYAGRWVVFDVPLAEPVAGTPVAATSDGEPALPVAERVIPLPLSLSAGTTPVRFEVDAQLFEPVRKADRAIIAVQYDSWTMQFAERRGAAWIVRFRPDTAFLWSSADTLTALGFDADDKATAAALKRQSASLGIVSQDGDPSAGEKPRRANAATETPET